MNGIELPSVPKVISTGTNINSQICMVCMHEIPYTDNITPPPLSHWFSVHTKDFNATQLYKADVFALLGTSVFIRPCLLSMLSH